MSTICSYDKNLPFNQNQINQPSYSSLSEKVILTLKEGRFFQHFVKDRVKEILFYRTGHICGLTESGKTVTIYTNKKNVFNSEEQKIHYLMNVCFVLTENEHDYWMTSFVRGFGGGNTSSSKSEKPLKSHKRIKKSFSKKTAAEQIQIFTCLIKNSKDFKSQEKINEQKIFLLAVLEVIKFSNEALSGFISTAIECTFNSLIYSLIKKGGKPSIDALLDLIFQRPLYPWSIQEMGNRYELIAFLISNGAPFYQPPTPFSADPICVLTLAAKGGVELEMFKCLLDLGISPDGYIREQILLDQILRNGWKADVNYLIKKGATVTSYAFHTLIRNHHFQSIGLLVEQGFEIANVEELCMTIAQAPELIPNILKRNADAGMLCKDPLCLYTAFIHKKRDVCHLLIHEGATLKNYVYNEEIRKIYMTQPLAKILMDQLIIKEADFRKLSQELVVQVSDCLTNYPQLNLPGNQEKLKSILLKIFQDMPHFYMFWEMTEEGIYYTSFTAFAIKKFKQTIDLFLGLQRDLSSFKVIEEPFKKDLLTFAKENSFD